MGQYTSYYLYQKFEKRGTQDWIPVYQNVYSINGDGTQPTVVKNQNDEECGYEPIVEPIYRWIEVTPTSDPSTYICDECEIDYSKQYLTFVPIESATTFSLGNDKPLYYFCLENSMNRGAMGLRGLDMSEL